MFLTKFFLRWVVCGLGLWVSAGILGPERMSVGNGFWSLAIAGLVLAAINILLKPILVFLALPVILISLGLFMIVVNGLIVLITSHLYSQLYVKNLGVAMIAGLIIGLVNYLVTRILEDAK